MVSAIADVPNENRRTSAKHGSKSERIERCYHSASQLHTRSCSSGFFDEEGTSVVLSGKHECTVAITVSMHILHELLPLFHEELLPNAVPECNVFEACCSIDAEYADLCIDGSLT